MCSRSGKATFSYTDMSVNSAPNWNIIPILRRMRYRPSRSSSEVSLPSTRAVPALGLNWAAMMRSSVVLPQPDCPMMPTTAPRAIVRLTSRSTGRAAS